MFAVYDDKTKRAEYIPPEWCDVEPLIDELITWYYNNQNLPAPILAAITSYAFVSIHPFTNGNGRTSRAIATYILMIKDYDFKGFNSFEKYYMSDLDGYYNSLQMGLPALFYDGRENPPHLEIWLEYFCKIMSLNSENIYYQAKEASNKDTSNVLNGMSKKDLVLIRYCLENNVTILKNKELASLFGVTSRAISKWMVEWVNKGILIPNGGTTRITSYKLSDKYASVKVSDIGFTD